MEESSNTCRKAGDREIDCLDSGHIDFIVFFISQSFDMRQIDCYIRLWFQKPSKSGLRFNIGSVGLEDISNCIGGQLTWGCHVPVSITSKHQIPIPVTCGKHIACMLENLPPEYRLHFHDLRRHLKSLIFVLIKYWISMFPWYHHTVIRHKKRWIWLIGGSYKY